MNRLKGVMGIQQLLPLAIIFVILGVALAIGSSVVQDIRDDQTSQSYAYNASDNALQALDEVAGWQSTIALVVVAAIIISILVGALYVKFGRGM